MNIDEVLDFDPSEILGSCQMREDYADQLMHKASTLKIIVQALKDEIDLCKSGMTATDDLRLQYHYERLERILKKADVELGNK